MVDSKTVLISLESVFVLRVFVNCFDRMYWAGLYTLFKRSGPILSGYPNSPSFSVDICF